MYVGIALQEACINSKVINVFASSLGESTLCSYVCKYICINNKYFNFTGVPSLARIINVNHQREYFKW